MKTVGEQAAALQAGTVTSEELVRHTLDAIDRARDLNAFVSVFETEAMATARERDHARSRKGPASPLDGVPVAVKDNFDVAGWPTTGACGAFLDTTAERDAAAVALLRAAGAVIVGKTNMHELAYGGTGDVSYFGPTRNPWDTACMAGGSSSGSGAAVAAGLVPAALGSDTGGSVRIPAAACGVTGLKPTFGRIDKSGVMPLSWSLDHVGPITRTVEDARLLLNILSGKRGQDTSADRSMAPSLDAGSTPTIKVARFPSYALDPQVDNAFQQALSDLEGLGYRLEPFDLTEADEAHVAWLGIMYPEAASCYARTLDARFEQVDPAVRTQLEAGRHISARQYLDAQRFRAHYQQLFAERLAGSAAMVMPSLPVAAPLIGQTHVHLPSGQVTTQDAMTFTNLTADMLGWPAVSVPCGITDHGLPVGLTVMTGAGADAAALAVAQAFQQTTDWDNRIPAT